MFVNNFLNSENGFTTSFTAMVLPVILILGMLILESGNFYIRHEHLRNLAKQSANSGIIKFSQILIKQAETNKNIICNVEILPEKCSSSNLFDFLTSTEIQNSIYDLNNKNSIITNTKNFAKNYDPLSNLSENNISVTFPFDYAGEEKVKLKVFLNEKTNLLFKNLSSEKEISVESLAFLSLK